MLTVVLISTASTSAYWLLGAKGVYFSEYHDPGYSLSIYAVDLEEFFTISAVVAIWHVGDVLEYKPSSFKFVRYFSSYAAFFLVLCTFGLCVTLEASGILTEIGPCGGFFNFLTSACYNHHPVLKLPYWATTYLLAGIAFTKLAVGLVTRVQFIK